MSTEIVKRVEALEGEWADRVKDMAEATTEMKTVNKERREFDAELRKAKGPVGPANDDYIRSAASGASRIVAAWGTNGWYLGRDKYVLEVPLEPFTVMCLGKTKHGFPRHPLYVSNDAELEVLKS